MSVWHDRGREHADRLGYIDGGRGNVVFADGHGEFVSRRDVGRCGDPRSGGY